MKASNLVDALNNFTIGELIFDPSVKPKNGQISEFYIDRKNNPYEKIKTLLISSRTFDKILFSGHIGSGKSTELNRLTNDGRMLSSKHYNTLQKLRRDKMAGSEDMDMELLQNLSAIEYLNAERWCDVNPIVLPLLEEWKRINP